VPLPCTLAPAIGPPSEFYDRLGDGSGIEHAVDSLLSIGFVRATKSGRCPPQSRRCGLGQYGEVRHPRLVRHRLGLSLMISHSKRHPVE
jgi:hypothetical protein